MRCEEIMSRDVVTLRRDATVQEAARLMADKDVGFIPVVDGGKAVGVLTDRDIAVRCVAKGNDCATTKVSEFWRLGVELGVTSSNSRSTAHMPWE